LVYLLKRRTKIFSVKNKVSDKNIKPKIVQTYVEDMAKVISDDKGGLIKKIIHEEEEYETEKIKLSPESKKNKLFLLIGSLLILGALATLGFFIFTRESSTVPIEAQFTPIIFSDKSDFIEITGFNSDKITQNIKNIVNGSSVKEGGIEGIYLTENKKIVGLRKFIALIGGKLVLNSDGFVNDNFLMGVVNNESKDFFILIKVRTLPDIFNSLRSWESKMFSDLHGFFGIDIFAETKNLLTANFEDGIVENKNARILYYPEDGQSEKKIAMMYIFANDNSVIIANTSSAAHEIMLRLAGSQIKK